MRRIIYLAYYFKNLDRQKFINLLRIISENQNIPWTKLLIDVIISSLKYNISLIEYFQFRFYEQDNIKRKIWAGFGYMYEYQRIMNPPKARVILDDKTLFYRVYKQFIKHNVADYSDMKANPEIIEALLSNPTGMIVFKVAKGKCGANVIVRKSADFNKTNILEFMKQEGYDLTEDYIIQHPDLMKLSPTAVNTIRIVTQLNADNQIEILGCRLRISVNSHVDNLAAGNIAAPIDIISGIITGPAVYNDITKPDEVIHPLTGMDIIGFKIPFWPETIKLAKAAANLQPQNRSVGWDIAMTENGPDLIEGNHDWCKLLWQLPVKQGLKPILERHLTEYQIFKKTE